MPGGMSPKFKTQANPPTSPAIVDADLGTQLHDLPPVVQRGSRQETGVTPSPSPQQKKLAGSPVCRPLQSCGQERQSSPSATTRKRSLLRSVRRKIPDPS